MNTALLFVALFHLYQGPLSDTATVARVGQFAVTVRDLRDSYAFGPAFVKRLPAPLNRHLQFMVYERLLAQHAAEMGMDTSTFVRERVEALEEDLAVDELYRREILDQVRITEGERLQSIREARINVRLRWLFAPARNAIERLQRQLTGGMPFDSLFARGITGTVDSSRRMMETTVLKLRRDNPPFAEHVIQMKAQQTSGPIAGPDGFYLVHIDEIWQNPLTTETEAARTAGDAEALIRMIRADALAGEYVREKMEVARPVIKAQGFDVIRAYIADRGLSRDIRIAWKIPTTFMTEAGPQPIGSSGHFLGEPLVTFGGRMLTVRDFARWYDIRQFQIKTSSLKAFNSSIRNLVWRMVQDKLLSQEAYSRGFQRTVPVRRETGEWRVKLLYLAARAAVGRSVAIDEEELRLRYDELQKRRKAPLPPFADVRQDLFEGLFAEKEHAALKHLINDLRLRYAVHINDSLLRRISTDVRSEPDAIEMMIYKPGGTFPRVAYPSIDDRWQHFR